MDTVIPRHVGIVLDGNRRWAKQHGLSAAKGHRQGMEVFRDIALHAFDGGVTYLSAYIFSIENWNRTEDEVSYLMSLILRAFESYIDTFHEKNIRIKVLGTRDRLNPRVMKTIEKSERLTAENTSGTLGLCFNYGGQQEIVDAVRVLGTLGKNITALTDSDIAKHLYGSDIPAVDLVIRTSGEQRLSGFMLWRAAYAELYFSEKLWPDFTKDDFDAALLDYAARQRRFGR